MLTGDDFNVIFIRICLSLTFFIVLRYVIDSNPRIPIYSVMTGKTKYIDPKKQG
jgi:hypothetical protein